MENILSPILKKIIKIVLFLTLKALIVFDGSAAATADRCDAKVAVDVQALRHFSTSLWNVRELISHAISEGSRDQCGPVVLVVDVHHHVAKSD